MVQLRPLGIVLGVDVETCDITRPEQIEAVLNSTSPDWVINSAAYTDVDGSESNPEMAREIKWCWSREFGPGLPGSRYWTCPDQHGLYL